MGLFILDLGWTFLPVISLLVEFTMSTGKKRKIEPGLHFTLPICELQFLQCKSVLAWSFPPSYSYSVQLKRPTEMMNINVKCIPRTMQKMFAREDNLVFQKAWARSTQRQSF